MPQSSTDCRFKFTNFIVSCSVGNICLARSSNGELYRAVVKGIADEKVIIRCVDHGHCEVKCKQDILAIPKEYLKQPPAVVEIWPARRFDRAERRDILRKFVGKNFAVKVSSIGARDVARFYENGSEIQFGADIKHETNVFEVVKEPQGISLSYVERVDKIWVQKTSQIPNLEFVMDKISSLGTMLSPTKTVGRKVGDFVVGRYQEDQEMYRAQIIELGAKEATIHFVDFGNKQTSNTEDLYELPESVNMTLYPAFAYFIDLKIGATLEDTKLNQKTVESLLQKENLTISRKVNQEIEFKESDEVLNLKSYLDLMLARSMKSCKVDASSKVDAGPVVECLRDADKLEDMPLKSKRTPEAEKKKPQRKMSVNLEGTLDQDPEDDIIILSPRLRSSSRGSKKVQEVTSHSWKLGDEVLAFWTSLSSWKEGIIHELDPSAALVVAKDNNLRPAYINLSLLKPVSMPLEALNKFEFDVGNFLQGKKTEEEAIPVINVKAKTFNNNDIQMEKGLKAQVTMTPSLIFSSGPEEFCQFARSGAGSRFLQSLVAPHNTRLCHVMLDLLLSSDSNLRMMTNAKSSYVFQKLLMHLHIFPPHQQETLLAEIESHFSWLSCDQFGYLIALTAIRDLGPEQRSRSVEHILQKLSIKIKQNSIDSF